MRYLTGMGYESDTQIPYVVGDMPIHVTNIWYWCDTRASYVSGNMGDMHDRYDCINRVYQLSCFAS